MDVRNHRLDCDNVFAALSVMNRSAISFVNPQLSVMFGPAT